MRLRTELRRADWLAEIQHLLLLCCIVSIAAGLLAVAATVGGDVELPLSAGSALGPDARTSTGLPLEPASDVVVRIEHPTPTQVGLGLLGHGPTWLLGCLALGLLWWLVRSARRGELFTDQLARRLRHLGWLVALAGPAAVEVQFLATFVLAGTLPAGVPQATVELGAVAFWVLLGFGVLAVSEVVRRGQVLRTELDGVV